MPSVAGLSPEIEPAVRSYQAALAQRFGSRLSEVRLFGSRARGDARPDSDVDLLVLIDDLTWREAVEAIDLGTEEELRSGVLLSPLPHATAAFQRLCELETGFARDVERDGVRL
jgi:predicted nucleotidyltransferase